MRLASLLLLAMVAVTLPARATEFVGVRLEKDGGKLTIIERGGAALLAPKIDDQDGFAEPGVSDNHRYAGWLDLFPNHGASYSQPIGLAVMDTSKRIRRFSGDFGMVFGWCFTQDSKAVVYRYEFPHGATPTGFDMRRLKDGKLLRRVRLEPIESGDDESQRVLASAPAWTRCAHESAASQ